MRNLLLLLSQMNILATLCFCQQNESLGDVTVQKPKFTFMLIKNAFGLLDIFTTRYRMQQIWNLLNISCDQTVCHISYLNKVTVSESFYFTDVFSLGQNGRCSVILPKMLCEFLLACFEICMPKISDKTQQLLLNYRNLLRDLLLIWTQ